MVKTEKIKNNPQPLDAMKKPVIFGILIVLLPFAAAEKGNMKLLAIKETPDGYKGSIADLYLDIRPGTGRVFLDTFPLTKLDTQMSTRFAKEIACDYTDVDCSRYDFFYTINADSPIIGGASAGSSIALLTISLLKDLPLKEDVAITGTINSGGLIGLVGGLKEKIEAGKNVGINTVLIPKASKILDGNKTIDAHNFSKSTGVKIVEVSTLDEALEEFTGQKIEMQEKNLTMDPSYTNTMKHLASDLCSRTEELKNTILRLNVGKAESAKKAENLTIKGRKSFEDRAYYSAASYCFGANVEYSYAILSSKNLTEGDILKKSELIKKGIATFNKDIKKDSIKTITDLEAYMVVKERLTEANDFLKSLTENIKNKEKSLHDLAYAIERLNSAKSWATFLDNRGREFNLEEGILKNSCKYRLSEAEERYQYVNLYYPTSLKSTRKEIDYAYIDLERGDYALCIFKASKAKANLDVVLSVFYVNENQTKSILSQKLEIVRKNLIKETQKGIFPILGYSYYEYATVLEEEDPYSALLYSEYALELSNLEIYFKEKKMAIEEIRYNVEVKSLWILIFGLIGGYLIAIAVQKQKENRRKKGHTKKGASNPAETSPAGKKR
jgi:uncharacterized protein